MELTFAKLKLIQNIVHSGKPTLVHALRYRLFLSVGVAQLVRRALISTLNDLYRFRIKEPAWRDETSQCAAK